MSKDKYSIVTARIIENMKNGTIPWHKPWNTAGRPENFATKRKYSGFNLFSLMSMPYKSNKWLTYKQAQDLGGTVKKGEKGTPVVYWNFLRKQDESNPDRQNTIPFMKYFTVFNIEQTEGIEYTDEVKTKDIELISEADKVISDYLNKESVRLISEDKNKAYYSPSRDVINLPDVNQFNSTNDWYATYFHELGHSTGIEKRLGRGLGEDTRRFGDHLYSKEELVAEFTSSILLAEFNLFDNVQFDNSTAYLQSWIRKLEDQPNLLVSSANAAFRAANMILDVKENVEETEE